MRSVSTAALVWLATAPAAAQSPADMPPGTWLEIPGTEMQAVTPSDDEFPGIWGVVGPRGITDAWNGGTLDTRRGRLIVTGGGHADYFGNELYAFDVAALAWERVTDPTANPTAGSDVNWDGTPQARHTYDGLAYIEHLDRFFVYGGSGSTIGDSGFPPTDNVWTYDFTASEWSYVATPFPDGPPAGEGSSAVYDPVTRLVWWGEGRNSNPDDGWGLWSWDPDADTWTHHTNSTVFSGMTGCYDSLRGRLVFIGAGRLLRVDLRTGPPTIEEWSTTGATGIVDETAPGFDYDAVTDELVAWQGGPVYALDPDTSEWRIVDAAGPPTPNDNGTYGRFAYVPSVNAFISVNHIDENVFFYKHGEGLGSGLPDAGPVPPRRDGGVSPGTDGGVGVDAGARGDGGAPADPMTTSGCSCRTSAAPGARAPGALPWLAMFIVLLIGARRHRQERAR